MHKKIDRTAMRPSKCTLKNNGNSLSILQQIGSEGKGVLM